MQFIHNLSRGRVTGYTRTLRTRLACNDVGLSSVADEPIVMLVHGIGRYQKPGIRHSLSFAQFANQLVPVFAQFAVGVHQVADLLAGVQHGGVVAAGKGIADFWQ